MGDEIRLEWSSLEELLPLCLEFANRVHAKEDVDLHDFARRAGQAIGVDDLDTFMKDQLKFAMEGGLGEAIDKKNAAAIAGAFAKQCKPVMTLVSNFAQGGMGGPEFIAQLNKIHFSMAGDLQQALADGLKVPDQVSGHLADQFGPYLVSVYCFAAAYKIYQKAANDAKLAHEHRLEIERLANESIAKLKAERAEMNDLVNSYLLDRLLPFGEGVAAMDEAVLAGDDDGYIRANAELWDLFGRDAQYRNAAEFDELMLSDEAFRL